MIDRFKIALPELRLNDALLCNPHRFEGNLPDLDLSPAGYNQRKGRHYRTIHLLPNRALSIYTEEIFGQWRALSISGTAPALIYGHNGRPLWNPFDLFVMLCRLQEVVSRVIVPEDRGHILPGLGESESYWSQLELHCHHADSDGSLMRAMLNMRHPAIRKRPVVWDDEAVMLKGKERSFKVYRKDLEMAKEFRRFHAEPPEPVVRCELELRQSKLTDAFPAELQKEIKGKSRLVFFGYSDMRTAFQNFTNDLQGVFPVTTHPGKISAMPCFLATIAKECNVPLEYFLDRYATAKGLSQASTRTLRKEATRHLESLSGLSANDLFSDETFDRQPAIAIPALEERLKGLDMRYSPADHYEIRRTYCHDCLMLLPGGHCIR